MTSTLTLSLVGLASGPAFAPGAVAEVVEEDRLDSTSKWAHRLHASTQENPMADIGNRSGWNDEDTYWRTNYRSRPYASSAGREYDYYQPGYRYGYEAATRYPTRSWDDVERDLSRDWNSYEHRGNSTWEQMKDAVRDAWDRMTGHRARV